MNYVDLKPARLPANTTPRFDASDNPTHCCPRFNPQGWNDQNLQFEDKLFAYAKTKSVAHIPLNMGKVFSKTFEAIEGADAMDMDQFVVLSRDLSPWLAEHYFATTKAVPGLEMARLSGDYHTLVFEGPYKEVKHWHKELVESVGGDIDEPPDTFFFYTTCPKCAKAYGKNYVIGVARTDKLLNSS
jgi:hypothetical protein